MYVFVTETFYELTSTKSGTTLKPRNQSSQAKANHVEKDYYVIEVSLQANEMYFLFNFFQVKPDLLNSRCWSYVQISKLCFCYAP
jgi:hypothetical protein